jgi:multiple sugar transport system permease protein
VSADFPTAPTAPPPAADADESRAVAPKQMAGGVMGKPRGTVATVVMLVLSLLWLFPLIWAVINSFRDYNYTQRNGYLSFGGWTISNYTDAWERGSFGKYFINSLYITVPAVILTLLLASMVAFVLARFSFRFNLALLGFFLAANLLPPQALLIPVFRMFREIPLPTFMSDSGLMLNSYWGLIFVNTAFQLGFCTFVLSNYMKTIPHEIYESAELDGASVWRQYWQLTMPLVRPALAALATLEVTWIYNEFFWATVLISDFSKLPITSGLNNLRGQFFTDINLVAAGSVMVALPVLVVFFALQKQFVSGLTLGSTKG